MLMRDRNLRTPETLQPQRLNSPGQAWAVKRLALTRKMRR
ncbi:hypothetical protein RISK_003309 [Rhodopirellula islandica]|uniref:Uncharacterized protein n=1 Tax=Rhodopirellula islandica TaxID=595434 RepID=A0A0J1BDL0_RHOIS|nr:hypothetical protein RISK_003309 [Rhodopirellula islandica]